MGTGSWLKSKIQCPYYKDDNAKFKQITCEGILYTTTTGKRIRAIRYKADFTYEEPTTTAWVLVVEDVKGNPQRTKEYTMKRKMMQDRLGITIRET